MSCRRRFAPLLALGALLALPAPALAAWSRPVTLDSGRFISAPAVAVDGLGRAAVGWSMGETVRFAFADRGRPFKRPASVRSRAGDPGQPAIALARGRASAFWYTSLDGERERLETAVVTPVATGPVRSLTPDTERLGDLYAGAARTGDVLAGWYEAGTVRGALAAPADRGALGPPFPISDARAYQSAFAVGPRGEAAAVWNVSTGIVLASYRPAGEAFGPPQRLSAPGGYAREPSVAFGPDGEVVAAWSQSGGPGYAIQTAVRPPQGDRFLAPRALPGGAGSSPEVAVDGDGVAAIVFDGGSAIRFSVRPASERLFAAARTIRGSAATGEDPLLGGDGRGGFVAAWTSGGHVFVSEASDRRFASARRVSDRREGGVEQPALAVGRRGDAILGWWGRGSTRIRIVRRAV